MREIVLDTETTGFDPFTGDRIVEIGAVELWNHLPTGRHYHQYINPARGMPADAFEIHGIGPDLLDPPRPAEGKEVTLRDKPMFEDVGREFAAFVDGAPLVIHNAAFDMKFLNYELDRMGLQKLPDRQAIDTVAMARRKYPGSPASLDALCRRFGIDNSDRDLHGALLDSQILAEVYLELIGGRQPGLELSAGRRVRPSESNVEALEWKPSARLNPLPARLSADERAAHAAFVAELGEASIWSKFKQE